MNIELLSLVVFFPKMSPFHTSTLYLLAKYYYAWQYSDRDGFSLKGDNISIAKFVIEISAGISIWYNRQILIF